MPTDYDQPQKVELVDTPPSPLPRDFLANARMLGDTVLHQVDPDISLIRLSDVLQTQADDLGDEAFIPLTWRDTLSAGNYSAEQLGEFVQTAFTWRNAQVERRGKHTSYGYHDIIECVKAAPHDKLREIYAADIGGSELRAMLDHSIETGKLVGALNFYKSLYDEFDPLKLADSRSVAWQDPNVRKLFAKKGTAGVLLRDFRRDYLMYDEELKLFDNPETHNRAQYDFARRFLRDIVRLPKKHRDELLFIADTRMHYDDYPKVLDSERVASLLELTAKNARALGNRAIRRLRDKAGIINIDYHSAEELKLMHNLIRGDKSTIEHLQAGNVTVLFNDELGDYNGAFKYMAADFATPDNRTLSFGVTKPGDIYRHMALLRKLGIKPSTIVVGAHGSPGSIFFGDVEVTNSDVDKRSQDPYKLSLSMAKGVPRIFKKYMQDHRKMTMSTRMGQKDIVVSFLFHVAWVLRLMRYSDA